MTNINIGWSEPTKTEHTLSDNSKVYGVFIAGMYDIHIDCISENAADNLISVWEHSVLRLHITR